MKRTKILHAIRQGKIGGGESHVLDLVTHLDPAKYESVVLSFTDGPMIDALKQKGIKHYVLHTEKPFHFGIWKQVRKLIADEKIDLVHAHGTRALSNTFRSAKSLNIPLIYTVHGWSFHPDQSFVVRYLREKTEHFLTRQCDKTICVSRSNQQDGQDRFNLKRSQVIYNAIDEQVFNPGLPYANIRRELGIADESFVIGYIVRFTNQKDPLTMLKGFKLLMDKNPNVHLLMVGEGALKDKAIAMVRELEIENKVTFQPFRSDVPALLNAIDLYCLPSLWEGFPIGILEAMAMQKPVVATPVDGTRELVRHNVTGAFIQQKNPDDLARVVGQLIVQPEQMKGLVRNAHLFVKENCTIPTQIEKIDRLYASFI